MSIGNKNVVLVTWQDAGHTVKIEYITPKLHR
jgi:hypothetical protein